MVDTSNITWYGRCCFLVELNNKRILFDPYDRFCNVDMGLVDAEILIVSSTWHDHGHIGASPGAWIFSYPGYYKHLGLEINGMEVKEERGTPTVVINVRYKNLSISNFADMGVYGKNIFNKKQRDILKTTNVAFIRSDHEKVLDFCNPKMIIPEHYFPRAFVENQIPSHLKGDFMLPDNEIDKMIKFLGFPTEEVDDYKYRIDMTNLLDTKIIRLLKIHPQVSYSREQDVKRYW